MNKIRVLVADDYFFVVEGLGPIIDHEDDLEVVGKANTVMEVLDLSKQTRPDVLVLDMAWPGDKMAGVKLISKLKRELPRLRFVAITNYPELMEDARNLGAFALEKGFTKSELLNIIRWAAQSPILPSENTVQPIHNSSIEPLTNREKDVLKLLGQGLSDREIADGLIIAEGTAKKHVSSILSKLGAKSRTEAVIKAQGNNLL